MAAPGRGCAPPDAAALTVSVVLITRHPSPTAALGIRASLENASLTTSSCHLPRRPPVLLLLDHREGEVGAAMVHLRTETLRAMRMPYLGPLAE